MKIPVYNGDFFYAQMGESKKDALRVNFDKKLKLEFHGVKVTSDAGLLWSAQK